MFSQTSEGTNLSAEVPPFVPRRAWNDEHGAHHSNSLPRYVTTCYPFVQEQQDRRHLNGSSNIQSLPVNQSHHWPPPSIYAPAIFDPNVLSGRPFPQNISIFSYAGAPGNIADSAQGNAVISSSVQSQNNGNFRKHHGSANKMFLSKNENRNKKKVMKKSVGVQKEVCGSDSEKDDPPVMVDNSQQTDFPTSVASKSLTDMPSPLRKVKNRRSVPRSSANESHDSSSDPADADVDSDSGYYSPKRQMGLTKTGGTNTDVVNLNQPGGPHPLMLLSTGGIPPSLLYASTSSQLNNLISPHIRPPASSASVLGYPPPDSSLLLNPSTSALNHAHIASRPPPGFPIPPSMLKPHEAMQFPDSWLWNHPQYPPNVRQPGPPYRYRRSYGKPQGNVHTPKKHQQRNSLSHLNQGFQTNRKQEGNNHGNYSQTDASFENNAVVMRSTDSLTSGLMLQDVSEFPGLCGDTHSTRHSTAASKLSYSQALVQPPLARNQTSKPPLTKSSEENLSEKAQKSRKRWKKAERASKAADEEYAEISQEQENIKKALKKTACNKNRKQTTTLDFGEIFNKIEAKNMARAVSAPSSSGKKSVQVVSRPSAKNYSRPKKSTLMSGANVLDSTMPSVRRGKERETPKVKKPSALKKVILKEREEKKEQRLQQLTTMNCPDHDIPPYPSAILKPTENEEEVATNLSQLSINDVPSNVPQIHSRRYREYCCQVLDKKIDEICTQVLQKLVYFQERMYQRDPIKAKMRRRLVMGIREVTKHLKLKKLKCVIVSPNLEKIQSKGGLDDALQNILDMCEEQNVTYIFALGRKAMGRAVSKLVPVSIVGIFDYNGVDDQYKKLVSLVNDAQNEYKEMISVYQQEVIKANTPSVPVASTSSKRFAHMTHSRNPSAASCVSFASFISEPISELNEDNNWRVLMDAGDDPPLSPTAEDEGSLSDDETGENLQKEAELDLDELSRKDSESTVVECKTIQELSTESALEDVQKDSSINEVTSDEGSSDYEDASSHALADFKQSDVVTPTNACTPESETCPLPGNSLQVSSNPDPPSLSRSVTLIESLEEPSSEDRINMWLEDSQCSITDRDEDENASSSSPNDKELSKDP